MITDNQTNKIYFSPFLEKECPKLWASIHAALTERGIRHGLLKYPNYIWYRDYMPIQIADDRFVAYTFRPDYLTGDMRYHKYLDCDGYRICSELTYPLSRMDLVIDGGNIVKCGDTIVMTEKVFYENGQKNRDKVEKILRETLQCNILFLPWDRDEEFGHSDGIVHFAGDGRVLMTNYEDFNPKMARELERRLAKKFDVIRLHYNSKRKHRRSWAYINFLQTEHLIMVPQLGAEEDEQALCQINAVFPDCETIGIPALEAVRRGGALNCISWNVKDCGAIPIRIDRYLQDVRNVFSNCGESFLGDDIFIPLKHFIVDTRVIPSPTQLRGIRDLLCEKKVESKQILTTLRHVPVLSGDKNKKYHQAEMWKLVISVLLPFVDQLQVSLTNPPFEFVSV